MQEAVQKRPIKQVERMGEGTTGGPGVRHVKSTRTRPAPASWQCSGRQQGASGRAGWRKRRA